MRANPFEHPILLTEAILNPLKNREKMVEIMFESFNVPATFVAAQPLLAAYASGRCTAMVADIGDGVCQVLPVYEGYTLPASLTRVDISGGVMTDYCMQLLKQRGYAFDTAADREVARQVKEKLCYFAEDYERELNEGPTKAKFELPNGETVTFGNERISIPEILFNPSLIGLQEKGLPEIVSDAINRCDHDTRQDFYRNLVVAGGTSLIPKFAARFEKEFIKRIPHQMRSRIIASGERLIANWIGGSIVASLSTFQSLWISAEEYTEVGPSILLDKDFVQFPRKDL